VDGVSWCGTENDPGQHLREDDLHFIGGKCRPETVAYAATERKELVRTRPLTEKPVGIEPLRVWPEVWPAMGEVDARSSGDAGRQVVPAEACWRLEPAPHDWDDGVEPLCLFDGSIEVLKLGHMMRCYRARADDPAQLRTELLEDVGALQDAVKHPRQGGRGSLVPSDEQGDHLIT